MKINFLQTAPRSNEAAEFSNFNFYDEAKIVKFAKKLSNKFHGIQDNITQT